MSSTVMSHEEFFLAKPEVVVKKKKKKGKETLYILQHGVFIDTLHWLAQKTDTVVTVITLQYNLMIEHKPSKPRQPLNIEHTPVKQAFPRDSEWWLLNDYSGETQIPF